ncbi:MAG TPA: hypothetical protein VFC07_08100 [Verrucomicrobiae bacterium]|nr:hypothetical protein [Verrucomicrobiae bacterium]
MKIKIVIVLFIAAFLGLVNELATRPNVNTKEVMRLKLRYAQSVLEGIATENFVLIQVNADKLYALSQSADWNIRQTPEYQRFTGDFSRQALALEKAAGQKNVDAATLAYFQMTASCVECHKYLRGARQAKLNLEKTPR